MSQPIQQYIPQDLSGLAAAPTPPGAQALVDRGTIANVNAPAQTELAVQQTRSGMGRNVETEALQGSVNAERTANTMMTEAAGEQNKMATAMNTQVENKLSAQSTHAQALLAESTAMMLMANGDAGKYTEGLGQKIEAAEAGSGRDPRKDVDMMISQAMSMRPKKA
tara:strand:+ start:582 stop:1079 length:498 start_codon:yes stop_codon:yes gene_type:complete